MKGSKKDFHEKVAENLIAQLKKGTAPWQRPWQPGDPVTALPHNATSGNRYKGINALQLMSQPFTDTRWMTYKQATALGAQVNKGEKGTLIEYWKFTDERIKKDDAGNPVLNSDGKPIKEQIRLERPRVFYASVFNAEQIDGLPKLEIKAPDWNPLDLAEEILQASNAVIHHGEQNRAFYRPSTDSIHLPHRNQFATPDRYYATALHELGHWSGSETRLNRDLSHPFGSEGYAKEELRAEIASMILGSELGIGHDPGQHAAYVGSWIKTLEEDHNEIFRAAADAEKIKDYVLAFSRQQEIVAREENTMDQTNQQLAKSIVMNKDQDLQRQTNAMENKQSSEIDPNISNKKDNTENGVATRQYLAVPYTEKDQAKAAGANWDNTAKSWFVGENADMQALQRWLPKNVSKQQEPVMAPETEFADLLRAQGCIVEGNHPIMDGVKQRIQVEGDKLTEKSGFYVAHLDGHPAGYFKNNRSGQEIRWKAKGYSLNDEQKAALVTEAAIKQQSRKAEQHEQQLKVAEAIKELLAIAPLADSDHPYLQAKNARPGDLKLVPQNADGMPDGSMIKIGKDRADAKALREANPDSIVLTAGDLLLPAQDIDGQIWSVQTIQPGGAKFFATGSKKESNFYVVDGKNQGVAALDAAPAIVIAEGYATADTLSKTLGYPIVAAFDSGNLPKVAQTLHEKYPHKAIIIAGDDDSIQESMNGKNPGKEKALEAAALVNGIAVLPIFAPGEQVSQKLSDFNDLANKSSLGIEAVKRQVGSVVEKATQQANFKKLQTQAEQNQQEKQQKRALAR